MYNDCFFVCSKQAIHSEKTFDFLHDLVKNVPDHVTEDDADIAGPSMAPPIERKPRVPRYTQYEHVDTFKLGL